MKLAIPTPADKAAVMDLRREFCQNGEQLLGAGGLENYEQYDDWLAHVHLKRYEQAPHPELPPATTFLCWQDGRLVGAAEIRHRLTDFHLTYTGHIGFSIRQSCRGRGLGTRLLALALDECRKLGLSRVLLTCSRQDAVSRSVIEANAGRLENEIAYEGDVRCRYWIAIPPAECRPLQEAELTDELFAGFIRLQEVTYCRRRVGVNWRMVYCPYTDDWTPEQLRGQIHQLQNILHTGGAVFGALADRRLKGFAAVKGRPIGPEGAYRDLASLHVSADCRGHGLGRLLFEHAAQWARENGAKKLYISSHSAQETQAFYSAMGCVDTLWPSPGHVALEPFDCQLEYTL